MRHVVRAAASGAACLFVIGCASTQLNYNALDLSGTVDDLLTNQIVYNLARFWVDSHANPTQVSIPSGSIGTTNQASASLGTPFNTAVTHTDQAATAAGAVIPAITRVSTGVLAATTITPSLNNQATQSWSLSPNTDADQERRLRALYRFATRAACKERDHTTPAACEMAKTQMLCAEYPLIVTQGSAQADGGDRGAGRDVRPDGGEGVRPQVFAFKSLKAPTGAGAACKGDATCITVIAYDAQFLREPSCIICSASANKGNPTASVPPPNSPNYCHVSVLQNELYINPRLKSNWLQVSPGGIDAPAKTTYIGNYLGLNLYYSDPEAYRQFVLFVLEATNLGSTAGQSGKSGPTRVLPSGAPPQPSILLQ